MSSFVPNKQHLREALLFCFNLKKNAAEARRLLEEAYGEHAPSKTTCEDWFKRFRSGDFDTEDKERSGRPKTIEDADLQALLDEDDTQTQDQLAEALNMTRQGISKRLHAMGKIQKEGKWVPHELTERQMENRRATSEILLLRHERKSFLHRIVTGDEKWIYFENPKRKKSWLSPGEASTSTARPNRFGKKTMLCVWWDQKGIVYYELLKPGETVNGHRYRQQLINLNHALLEKRPEWDTRHERVILQHDNAPCHRTSIVQDTIKTLKWDLLPHPPYSPDLAPSDYHLFRSMAHGLAGLHLANFEEVQNWLDEWFRSKDASFYRRGIHVLPERWQKCVASEGRYFE